jgi:hypothetical protein
MDSSEQVWCVVRQGGVGHPPVLGTRAAGRNPAAEEVESGPQPHHDYDPLAPVHPPHPQSLTGRRPKRVRVGGVGWLVLTD